MDQLTKVQTKTPVGVKILLGVALGLLFVSSGFAAAVIGGNLGKSTVMTKVNTNTNRANLNGANINLPPIVTPPAGAVNWQLPMAFSGSYSVTPVSTNLVIGTNTSATDRPDIATGIDVSTPDTYLLGVAAAAFQIRPAPSAPPYSLFQDLRAPITTGMKVWFGTAYGDSMTVRWNPTLIPAGYNVRFIAGLDNVDMKTNSTYTFHADSIIGSMAGFQVQISPISFKR